VQRGWQRNGSHQQQSISTTKMAQVSLAAHLRPGTCREELGEPEPGASGLPQRCPLDTAGFCVLLWQNWS